MKRILTTILLLLIPAACFGQAVPDNLPDPVQLARMSVIVVGGGSGGDEEPPAGCPSGTYAFAWNGDHPSGTTYGCAVSTPQAAASSTGDISTDYGMTGYGWHQDAADEAIRWTVTANDIIDDEVGTIWMWVRSPAGGCDANTCIFEYYADSNDKMWISFQNSEVIRADNDLGDAGGYVLGTHTISENTWTLIGYSWDAANDLVAVTVNSDGDSNYWEADETVTESETVSPATDAPPDCGLGELDSAINSTCDIEIDNVYIIKSYKANYPGS